VFNVGVVDNPRTFRLDVTRHTLADLSRDATWVDCVGQNAIGAMVDLKDFC
jgi:hypothetical protein